jgi:hypothetical protein
MAASVASSPINQALMPGVSVTVTSVDRKTSDTVVANESVSTPKTPPLAPTR